MKKKILIAIYIILAATVLIFVFMAVKQRYFQKPGEEKPLPPATRENPPRWIPEKDYITEPEAEKEAPPEEKKFREITEEDCAGNCQRFENEIELKYCRQICGLLPIKTETENCEDLSELEKDYCLKDFAVSKKDFKICEQISDGNIKKTCKNRITEEILNGN